MKTTFELELKNFDVLPLDEQEILQIQGGNPLIILFGVYCGALATLYAITK